MTEFRISWAQCPTAHNPTRLMFVEAETEENARIVAKDHIERTFGIGWFSIFSVTPYTPPAASLGRVIG